MSGQAVREWLVLLTMEKYTDNFLESGYDCIAQCKLIISSDLVMLGVDNESHRKLLLGGVQFLINSPEYPRLEPCEQHGRFESEEESVFEGSAVAKFSELFEFLDTPKGLPIELIVDITGSPDQDELSMTPRKSRTDGLWNRCTNTVGDF